MYTRALAHTHTLACVRLGVYAETLCVCKCMCGDIYTQTHTYFTNMLINVCVCKCVGNIGRSTEERGCFFVFVLALPVEMSCHEHCDDAVVNTDVHRCYKSTLASVGVIASFRWQALGRRKAAFRPSDAVQG